METIDSLFTNLGCRMSLDQLHSECLHRLGEPTLRFLRRVYEPLDKAEKSLMDLKNLGTMLNQLTFFASCSGVMLPGQPATAIYTLMFFNVFAYCISYIKELCEKEDWSPYVNVAAHSNMKHLAMTATKIALEWTKAVTFIVTIVFILLVFGLEQGLKDFKPTLPYTILTWIYYLSTEKVFVSLMSWALDWLQLPALENLERLWLPVCLHLFTAGLSLLVALASVLLGRFKSTFALLYLNVFLRLKEMNLRYLRQLRAERAALARFRHATAEELANLEDVCAVCLVPMQAPRVTPCHHFFHGKCLRECLKTSDLCPICKRPLEFS